MVIENGFSYYNFHGDYYLENGYIEFDSENKVSNVYTDFVGNTHERQIFIEFASLNTKDNNEILSFCNHYGRIGVAYRDEREGKYQLTRLEQQSIDKFLKEFGEDRLEYYFGFEKIEDYIIEINKMSAILNAKEALDGNKLEEAAYWYLYLFFVNSKRYEKGYTPVRTDDEFLLGLKFIFNIASQNGLNITDEFGDIDAHKAKEIIFVDEFKREVTFKNTVDIKQALSNISEGEIFHFISSEISEIINTYIWSIRPVLSCNSRNQFNGMWKSPRLLSSMYMEIFLKFSQNAKFKKCRNSTCYKYFEIIGNYKNKIYCSVECACLEAKRKERARKKEKQIQET